MYWGLLAGECQGQLNWGHLAYSEPPRVLRPSRSIIKITEAGASVILMVGEKGLEPLRPEGHKILSLARLPVPPLARCDTNCLIGIIDTIPIGTSHVATEDRIRYYSIK